MEIATGGAPSIGPIAPQRLVTLDAIRGVAVIGILLMNIISFSMPLAAATNPHAWGGDAPADMAAFTLSSIFVESKMRGLFSLLFGASMVLVIDRADAQGHNGGEVHFYRMISLLMIGLCHMYFLWHGDILTLYAVCGMVAFFFLDKPPKTLLAIAAAFFVAAVLGWAAVSAGFLAMTGFVPEGSVEATQTARNLAVMLGEDPVELAKEATIMRGSYADILAYRAGHLAVPFSQIFMVGAETIMLMLIGAAMQRSGFFNGGWTRARLGKLALYCGIPALVALSALTLWLAAQGYPALKSFLILYFATQPFDYMLAVAYAAGLVLLVSRFDGSALVKRLAATGRAAFSNYLATSLVMTTIFYGYGLGLFGHIDRAPIYLFVLGGAVMMLLWSKPWLERFHYGPMEWLWRSMAKRKLQPMRKR